MKQMSSDHALILMVHRSRSSEAATAQMRAFVEQEIREGICVYCSKRPATKKVETDLGGSIGKYLTGSCARCAKKFATSENGGSKSA